MEQVFQTSCGMSLPFTLDELVFSQLGVDLESGCHMWVRILSFRSLDSEVWGIIIFGSVYINDKNCLYLRATMRCVEIHTPHKVIITKLRSDSPLRRLPLVYLPAEFTCPIHYSLRSPGCMLHLKTLESVCPLVILLFLCSVLAAYLLTFSSVSIARQARQNCS